MISTQKKLILLILILITISTGFIFWEMGGKYLQAEGKLKSELAAFNIPSEFELQSSVYKFGTCLDNCPAIRNVYKVSNTREHLGQIIKQELEMKEYKVNYSAGRVSTTPKDNITISSSVEPELGTGTRDYAMNKQQQSQQITSVTLDLEFRP